MLLQTIGGLLPFAAAVALSPIPIVAVVLMLATPRANTNGPAFAAGWVIGLLAVTIVVGALASGADDRNSTVATAADWLRVVVGVLLLGLALKKWRTRPKTGEEPSTPAWMASIDRMAPGRAFVLGLAFSGANPKNLALTAAAAASIAQAGMDDLDTVSAVVVYVVLGSVTVVGAVLVHLLAGERAAKPLAALKTFMLDNNAVIMMVILLLLGAKILGDGLSGLSA